MPIVTISRGTYSGGMELGECVARCLDVPCVSREIIVDAAQRFGVSEESLAEAMGKPPSFFERFSHQRDMYLSLVRSGLVQQAASGSFVYHGHSGHLLLADVPTVLKVRVVAPLPFRVRAAMERLGVDQKEATLHIEKVDHQRERWTRFLYGVEWQDPALYDLVINLEHIEVAEACEVVCQLARLERFQCTDAVKNAMTDLALASMVSAELARDERTRAAHLQVAATAGTVTIRGRTRLVSTRDAIPEVVGKVSGVQQLELKVAVSSEVPS